ncbi:MsnO8 family LLM class oxidoreductase [Novosphingobium terrae]|uniref:MsnO8 family LLM class oxidoreductase n=1 Tax=Novosphingobium terrae TaxID=2726189 RepID=UPI00197F1304|nr:MsnO8 family LLM class oxidoreductase [Novosphingobium terrae]
MTYRLSILDKALIPEGLSAPASLAQTVELAVLAERLGFHRYWFAEHHGMANLASSAPELLAAHVLARTQHIRVGTGGVMLQHYAPFKVAESFNLLAALAPGRVDLGVGKAPGGLPHATGALRPEQTTPADFDARLRDLDGFLTGSLPESHPYAGAIAAPQPTEPARRILLGASTQSAALAAELDWDFCYAGHFDGDPQRMKQAFDLYRAATGRSPLLALVAFAAPSEEEAKRLVGLYRFLRLHLSTGQRVNVPNEAVAAEFARQAGVTDYTTQEIEPNILTGTGDQLRAALDDLSATLGVEDFVIDAPVADHAARRTSLQELARAILSPAQGPEAQSKTLQPA